jgi:hypothetical protein
MIASVSLEMDKKLLHSKAAAENPGIKRSSLVTEMFLGIVTQKA